MFIRQAKLTVFLVRSLYNEFEVSKVIVVFMLVSV